MRTPLINSDKMIMIERQNNYQKVPFRNNFSFITTLYRPALTELENYAAYINSVA